MTALSKQVVNQFCQLCSWAHEAWATHRTMFDDNPSIESIRLIGHNSAFLDRISIVTQEYALLQIAKLHDPALQANQLNLTLEYVVRYGGWDAVTLTNLEKLKSQLDTLKSQIKPARNKVICHNDLLSLLNPTPLGAFTKDADVQYFNNLEEFVSIVCLQVVGTNFEFAHFAQHDAKNFMECLQRG